MDTLLPPTLCTTVGNLRAMLADLDDDMPVLLDGVEGIELAVREEGMTGTGMLVVYPASA